MSKRVAERELTDRNWDQEDEVEEAGEFTKASDDTLKRRHVIKAKRRGATDKDSTAFSGFAGFGGFKPVQTSTPFNFSTKSMTNGKAEEKKAESPFLGKTETSPKANGKQDAKGEAGKKDGTMSDKNENSKAEKHAQYLLNLKNLNESVLAWIRQHVEKNPYCILTPIFNDYDKHLKVIEKDKGSEESEKGEKVRDAQKDSQTGKDGPNSGSTSSSQESLSSMFKPATGSWTCDTCLISNKAEVDKCVACQSPKPSAKAAPTQLKTETSSLSDKFKPPASNWTCDTCLVSNTGDKTECIACQTAKPGSSKPAATEKPATGFSIGKDAFSSSNTFTIKSSTNGTATGASAFSFGSANPGSNSTQGSGKGFTFGTASSTDSSAKSITFGTSSGAKPFSFGTSSSSSDKKSDAEEKPKEDSKSYTYGKGFSFGSNKDQTGKSYSFGDTVTSSGNTALFGTSATASFGKTFSFGTSSSSSDGKTFSFGLAKNPSAMSTGSSSGFGLTGSSNDTEKKPEDGSLKVTPTGFSGFNFKPSAPLFGAPTTGSSTLGTPSGFSFAVGNSAQPSSSTDKEEEEYQPPIVESVENKEEGALYTVKCKLFYQKDGSYVERGVGFLNLKMADDKLQMVVRADTTLGNILLNIAVPSTMPVQRQGKNNLSMICIPNPPINPKDDTSKPVPMLVRVKTGDDADKLLEKIDELRKK